MNSAFYLAAAVAVVSTLMAVTRRQAVHALLYLVVSLLSVALIFSILGAAFVAALEVIIYAGAVMVLFVFVVMLLNLGERAARREAQWLRLDMWVGPAILAAVLVCEIMYMFSQPGPARPGPVAIGPKEVSAVLFGPYGVGVELASMVLLAGLVGGYHFGRPEKQKDPE
jgi:NADH-quinone oxidoreductase subunit J